MSKKFLVAIDGSEGAERALAYAVSQSKNLHASLVLAYIIDWSPYSFHTPEELEERHKRRESEIQRANDSVLAPHVFALNDSGLHIETVVRHGKIAESLADLSTELKASQIYIGRLGESRLRSMLFGSVTAALVQSSAVPVTVVP